MGLNEKGQGRYEMNTQKTKTIVFVCIGNTCRSPMAEALLKSELKRLHIEEIDVCSAGLRASGKAVNAYAAKTLLDKGLELNNFNSRNVDESLLCADVLIAMTDEIKRKLVEIQAYGIRLGKLPKNLNNVYSFRELTGYEVPDPYGRGDAEYQRAFEQLEGGMSAIIEKFVNEKPKETKSQTTAQGQTPKKRGRPRGSKNKKPYERKTPSKPKTAQKKKTNPSTEKKEKTTYIQERIL